jgi:hypothetical protein
MQPEDKKWLAKLFGAVSDSVADSGGTAVGIATGYGLGGQGSQFESRLVQDFYPLHVVQTGSGAHSAFYPVGTGLFPRE